MIIIYDLIASRLTLLPNFDLANSFFRLSKPVFPNQDTWTIICNDIIDKIMSLASLAACQLLAHILLYIELL